MATTAVIESDLRQAIKGRQTEKVAVLRMMVAALKNRQIELGKELPEVEVAAVLKKEAKKRQESIVMFKQGKRQDLVDKETRELEILKSYLPKEMSGKEIIKLVEEMKQAGEINEDFGRSMGLVMAKLKGQADGKLVAEAVKQVCS